MSKTSSIKTKYGMFTAQSKKRLDLTYDYEDSAIIAFFKIVELLNISYFFDIGANIGCYSVYLSRIKNIKKIFAFEPAPASFHELKKNIALQDANNEMFSLFNIPLSDVKKTVKFLIVSEMSGVNRIDDKCVNGKHIEVSCEPLDAIVKFKNEKIALKIDVEGHEILTVLGMKDLIRNNHCLIQVECLEDDNVSHLKQIMSACGYILVFVLRDDYIFLSASLVEVKDTIQQIYFKAIQNDLRDLLNFRTNRRSVKAKVLALMDHFYDPVLI